MFYGRYITCQSDTIKMYSPVKYVFAGQRVILLCLCQGITRDEDVVHNREGSVRFFISNIFEMA